MGKGGKKRRRTSLEIEEEQTRTLYIRTPYTIKNVNEIKELFFGNFKIKLPRKFSRHCHITFSSIQEKVKNLKALKKKVFEGKRIVAGRPINEIEKNLKLKQNKNVSNADVHPESGKYLYIYDIPLEATASEIIKAFPGAKTIVFLNKLKNDLRQARIKMSSNELCLHYVYNNSEWPILHGRPISVAYSKKNDNNNKNNETKENLNLVKMNYNKIDESSDSKAQKENVNKKNTDNNDDAQSIKKDEEQKYGKTENVNEEKH